MWENAAPPPQPEEKPRPCRPKSEEDLVLWAQVLLCLAAIGFVLAARALGWPVYPELRRAFAAALQPEQSLLLGEERGLLRFTEQTAQELADAARSMWEEFHLGNDLAAAEGTAVLAAADGVVRMAGRHKSYGNYLRVLHADGDETLYAHLQYLFVRAGEAVSAGQTLGTVGQTGNATGPHLHFEILHRGLRYDPAAALQHAS